MRRRDFIKVIVGSGAAWPLVARAQQSAIPVIGFLGSASPEPSRVKALWGGLGEAEYVEGRNCAIEFRWAKGQYSLLPALAAALVSSPRVPDRRQRTTCGAGSEGCHLNDTHRVHHWQRSNR
jgi:putative ABC transport system substrate-binding protein